MQPECQIKVDGADRTAVLNDRLLSIRLTDTDGKEADELELTFDDRDNKIAIPRKGAVIEISLGYVGKPLVNRGKYTVDDVAPEGPPDKLTVRAKAADVRGSLKVAVTKSWRETTVGDMMSEIGAKYSMDVACHPDLAGVAVAHRDQSGESDLHFLTRLGEDHDAVVAVKGGKLVLAPKGKAVSGTGKSLPTITLNRTDLKSWRMGNGDRDKCGSVRARHRDLGSATTKFETTGDEAPVRTLRHVYPSAELASSAAHAEHRKGKRKAQELELEPAMGMPDAFAGQAVVVAGVRDGVNGKWVAKTVTLDVDWEHKGFTTSIKAAVDGLTTDPEAADPDYAGDDADPDAPDDSDGGGE